MLWAVITIPNRTMTQMLPSVNKSSLDPGDLVATSFESWSITCPKPSFPEVNLARVRFHAIKWRQLFRHRSVRDRYISKPGFWQIICPQHGFLVTRKPRAGIPGAQKWLEHPFLGTRNASPVISCCQKSFVSSSLDSESYCSEAWISADYLPKALMSGHQETLGWDFWFPEVARTSISGHQKC